MNIPVADGHCDFLYGMWQNGYAIDTLHENQAIHLPYLRQGGVALQFFAAWTDMALKTPPLQQCIGMIDAYHRMLEKHTDEFVPYHQGFDPSSGKIATVLTVEGGEAIEGSLAVLRVLKRLGVAAMTLTWNSNNELAGAAAAFGNKGLTSLGRDAVREMECIGVAIDVAHLSDAGIDELLSFTKKPIFASHSNARAVYNCPRALKDAHIKAIAQQGGVIGVNFFYKQLCPRDEAHIDDIVRHILHIVKIGGVNCCAIGSDFDGMTRYPNDLKNSAAMQALLQALLDAGLSREDVERIAYKNLAQYILQFV